MRTDRSSPRAPAAVVSTAQDSQADRNAAARPTVSARFLVGRLVRRVSRSDANGDQGRFNGQLVRRPWQRG
jgi:hypothetical protein